MFITMLCAMRIELTVLQLPPVLTSALLGWRIEQRGVRLERQAKRELRRAGPSVLPGGSPGKQFPGKR